MGRVRNPGIDFILGMMYFLTVFSLLPLCNVRPSTKVDKIEEMLDVRRFGVLFKKSFEQSVNHILAQSYVSFSMLLVLVGGCFIMPTNKGYFGMFLNFVFVAIHFCTAVSCCIIVEHIIETARDLGLTGRGSAYDTVMLHFPNMQRFLDGIDHYTYVFGWLLTRLIRAFIKMVDICEFVSDLRHEMCTDCPNFMREKCNVSRVHIVAYYVSTAGVYFMLSTVVGAFIMGVSFFVMTNFLETWFFSFSSLRIEGSKSFLRMHITEHGDLEVFNVGIDRMPRDWEEDPTWDGGKPTAKEHPSYTWRKPSRWIPSKGEYDWGEVSIVDQFKIRKHYMKASDQKRGTVVYGAYQTP